MENQIQGQYTDYQDNPYSLRMRLAPLHGEELEAFNFLIGKLQEREPKAKQSELVEKGFDLGYFMYGNDGELRVDPNAKVNK